VIIPNYIIVLLWCLSIFSKFAYLPGSLTRNVLNNQPKVCSPESAIRNSASIIPVVVFTSSTSISVSRTGVSVGKLYLDTGSVKGFPIEILYGVLSVLLVIYFQESILSLDIYISKVSIAAEQFLDIPLAAVVSQVSQEQSWHDDSDWRGVRRRLRPG